MPRTFLAWTETGEIVIASTSTGGIERVIATRRQVEGKEPVRPWQGGHDIYFNGRDECSKFWVLPAAGDFAHAVATGYDPQVSPDGKRLAYAVHDLCGDKVPRIVVRDLATGRERRWLYRGEPLAGGFGSAVWAPGGRSLLVLECGADACSPFLLDTAKRGDKLDGNYFGPEAFNDHDMYNLSLGLPVIRGRLGTAIFGVDYSEGGIEPQPVIEYNPKTKRVRNIFADRRKYIVVDADASGSFLLYYGPDGELFAWYVGKSIRIGPGYASAEW
jgi:hypothetical protein